MDDAYTKINYVVIREQRLKNTDSIEYAKRIQEQVTILLNAGVPATIITVLGASKGCIHYDLCFSLPREPRNKICRYENL